MCSSTLDYYHFLLQQSSGVLIGNKKKLKILIKDRARASDMLIDKGEQSLTVRRLTPALFYLSLLVSCGRGNKADFT